MSNSKKGFVRGMIFFFLLLVLYLTFCVFLFIQKKILWALVAYGWAFIALLFFAIDAQKIIKKNYFPLCIVWGVVLQVLLLKEPRQLSLVMWISLWGLLLLYWDLTSYFQNVRTIRWFTYFFQSGYWFTMIITILLGFSLLGLRSKFPFSCNQITSRNENFFSSSSWFSFSKESDFSMKNAAFSESENIVIKSLRKDLKWNIQNWFFETQKKINNQICQVIVNEVEKVYKNPFFQWVVVFAVYLLFYSILRLGVVVITFWAYLFFILMHLFKCYKIQKVNLPVEKIVD